MFKFILGFTAGLITALVIKVFIIYSDKKKKFARNCLNCAYSIPYTGRDNEIHLYCNLAKNKELEQYPIRDYNCCGHFCYTEELKLEQVKEQAERYVK